MFDVIDTAKGDAVRFTGEYDACETWVTAHSEDDAFGDRFQIVEHEAE